MKSPAIFTRTYMDVLFPPGLCHKRMCFFKLFGLQNVLEQASWSHEYGLPSEWIFKWNSA